MILVNKVVLNPKVLKGKIGQIVYFGYSVAPSNATDKSITVTSSKPSVVEVFENSFRFHKTGAAVITISSNDGGYNETYTCFCESEYDFLATAQELENRLQKYYDTLKIALGKDKDLALTEIANEKYKLLEDLNKVCSDLTKEVKKIAEDNVGIINKELQDAIEALEEVTADSIKQIESMTKVEIEKVDAKLLELNNYLVTVYDSIKSNMDFNEANFNLYMEDAINAARAEVDRLTTETIDSIQTKLQNILLAIDRREEFAIANMNSKYTQAIDLIESAEVTAIEDIKLVVEELKGQLHLEVEGIDNIINGELNKALTAIKTLSDKVSNDITALGLVITNTVDQALQGAIAAIDAEVGNVKDKMFEYMLQLNDLMTKHKDKLMEDIIADKDAILIEFEVEANRLIMEIREKEHELFQDLQAIQQAIINRIQLVTQAYDAQMEEIKLAKIAELELIIDGYDTQIENARLAAANSITEIGDSYLADLLNTRDAYVAELTELKNRLSNELTTQYNEHSTALLTEYTTHSTSLEDKVENPTTGLRAILLGDYTTHSNNLLAKKTQYTSDLTTTKDSGLNEITNLKNKAMDEIGRDIDNGLWKLVRDSVIATCEEQRASLTAEGNRLLSLFSDIEVEFVRLTDEAIATIGTSDSTGLRGDAVASINAHIASAESRLGISDTAMDGESPSLRKEIVDRLVALGVQKEQEVTQTGNIVTEAAYNNMNDEKDKVLIAVTGAVVAGEEQMTAAMRNIIATKEENEASINALHTATTTDIENKRVAAVDSIHAHESEAIANIHTAEQNAVDNVTSLTTITAAEVDAIWAGI